MTDTHCHIFLPEFDPDRDQAVERAVSAGVRTILMPNVDRSTTPALLDAARRYPDICLPMMGVHPTSVGKDYGEEIAYARSMLEEGGFYGIGETGMDLYWDKTYREEQEEAFRIQLEWSVEFNLPVVIHVRESHDETVAVIRRSGLSGLKGIFHCFGGSAAQAEEIIGLGFHLGIGGVSTFKNSSLGQVLPGIDINRIVLETDAPYLAPVPHRGKRNEPAWLALTAERVAGIYGMPVKELVGITSKNARQLFGL